MDMILQNSAVDLDLTLISLPRNHESWPLNLEPDNARSTTRPTMMSDEKRDAAENESPIPANSTTLEDPEAVEPINAEENLPSGGGGVIMVHGDIFAAPTNSVLIHACNCQGSWGAGIALAFKQLYPAAYRIYHNHCTNVSNPSSLLGTTLLIPPQPTDRKTHWIACYRDIGHRIDY
ncbi:ADP-ribose 1''-phosphate phosphatase [Orbilia oligospora]|nr:ADP-ribose 1''-phosphate phosphatase [Orbilia oligospora]